MKQLARNAAGLAEHPRPGGAGQSDAADDRRDIAKAIEWRAVSKRYWKGKTSKTILERVNLDVAKGEFLTVVGPSGCGKTTLLNIAAGLTHVSGGQIMYDGQQVQGVNRRVGYLTQKDTLLPWRRVRDNVMLPLQLQGMTSRARRKAADDILDQVGLRDFKDHYPAELSGGMRRRVLIARTLVYNPETLLMDEPFVSLDAQTQLRLQDDLLKLWEERSFTVVFVTHDLSEAVALADRVAILARPPNGVRGMRTVEIERPRDVLTVRSDARYARLLDELWHELEATMRDGVDPDMPSPTGRKAAK